MDIRGRRAVVAAIAALLVCSALLGGAEAGPEEEPRSTGLVEKVTRRLAQIDVTVTAKKTSCDGLGPGDFDLTIGGKDISGFSVDAVLVQSPTAPDGSREGARIARPASYLFYFDQKQTNPSGRGRALGLARALVPILIVGGSRGVVVSSGNRLVTYCPLTTSHNDLLAALDRLEKDGTQVDVSAWNEERNAAELERILRQDLSAVAWKGRRNTAVAAEDRKMESQQVKTILTRIFNDAGRYKVEETQRADQSLGRLALALNQLHGSDPPRIVVYFADTLRMDPGEHYFRLVDDHRMIQDLMANKGLDRSGIWQLAAGPRHAASFGSAPSFDELVRAAATHGARFYAVEAAGGQTPSTRLHDAQKTLSAMALETGGRAFLNGASAETIAGGIEGDLACMYLLSFDATGLREDTALPVWVHVKREGLKARSRGRTVIQSKGARLRSDRIAALYTAGTRPSDPPVRIGLVPLGFRDGAFRALVQVGFKKTPVSGKSWDLRASFLAQGDATLEISGRVAGVANRPLVLEREVRLEPGSYSIVAIAQEPSTEWTATGLRLAEWPDPDAAPATVGPIVLLQPAEDGLQDASGTRRVALDDEDPAHVDAPIALVGIVCRSKDGKGSLRVTRRIEGERVVDFPPIDFPPADDRCIQVRDLIAAGTLGTGYFRYEIRVDDGPDAVARGVRQFEVTSSLP